MLIEINFDRSRAGHIGSVLSRVLGKQDTEPISRETESGARTHVSFFRPADAEPASTLSARSWVFAFQPLEYQIDRVSLL